MKKLKNLLQYCIVLLAKIIAAFLIFFFAIFVGKVLNDLAEIINRLGPIYKGVSMIAFMFLLLCTLLSIAIVADHVLRFIDRRKFYVDVNKSLKHDTNTQSIKEKPKNKRIKPGDQIDPDKVDNNDLTVKNQKSHERKEQKSVDEKENNWL